MPLPNKSLCCGSPVIYEDTKPQYQEDIVRRTISRRFNVEIGRCAVAGDTCRVGITLQTSDALSLAAHLNKEMGISHERVARVLELGYGCGPVERSVPGHDPPGRKSGTHL